MDYNINYYYEYFEMKNRLSDFHVPKEIKFYISGFFLKSLFDNIYGKTGCGRSVNNIISCVASIDYYVALSKTCELFSYPAFLDYYNILTPNNKVLFNIWLLYQATETGVVEEYNITEDKEKFEKITRKTAKPKDSDIYKLLRCGLSGVKYTLENEPKTIKSFLSLNSDDPENVFDVTVFVRSCADFDLIPLGIGEEGEYICLTSNNVIVSFNAKTKDCNYVAPNIYAFVRHIE